MNHNRRGQSVPLPFPSSPEKEEEEQQEEVSDENEVKEDESLTEIKNKLHMLPTSLFSKGKYERSEEHTSELQSQSKSRMPSSA